MASQDHSHLLNSFQKEVYQECLVQKSGGLSLTMGSGKTLLSIVVALKQSPPNGKILVICSKSLIPVWLHEIKKFFGKELSHQVLHRSYLKKMNQWTPEAKLVITTPGLLGNTCRDHVLHRIVRSHGSPPTHYYYPAQEPLLEEEKGLKALFSTRWSVLIVDEVHDYTNARTNACRGLIGICSDQTWLLSGTVFKEPAPERILGYYSILGYPDTPRCLPDVRIYTKLHGTNSRAFPGLASSMVIRESNPSFTHPRINKKIISHQMSAGESQIYLTLKSVLKRVLEKVEELKDNDPGEAAVYRAYGLALIIYLRQVLVCAHLPITGTVVKSLEIIPSRKKRLAKMILQEVSRVTSQEWINDPGNVESSRIRQIVSKSKKYSKEPIVIFTSYRKTLNLIKHFLPEDRPVFTLEQGYSFQKRGEVLEEFEKSTNGILLLTYTIGSSGYNLQVSKTVFLADFWWNAGTTQQAIARVLRFGQKSSQVNILYFTSNTALEKMIYRKHKDKIDLIRELYHGPSGKKLKSMKIEEIIQFTQMKENEKYLRQVYF